MHAAHGLSQALRIEHIPIDHRGRGRHAGQEKLRSTRQAAQTVGSFLQRFEQPTPDIPRLPR